MSEESDAVTVNVRGLDQILKALKRNPPQVRIGILGGGPRSNGKTTNAEVGAAHEFGTSRLPQRSFLRIPISDHLEKRMESSGALDPKALKEVIEGGSLIPWITKIAIIAENIVLDAFDTGGFGKWSPWKGSYISKTGNMLVNTAQLRNSITYEVDGA